MKRPRRAARRAIPGRAPAAAPPPLVLDAHAAAPPPPLALDAHADTLDHVVRAVARSGFLEEATRLMLASREYLHDPELLYRTRGVRGKHDRTLLMRAVMRLDVARAAEILGACPTPATRVELLACVDDEGFNALHLACHQDMRNEAAALRLVELLLANGADPLALSLGPSDEDGDDVSDESGDEDVLHAIHNAAQWSARLVQRLVQAGASIDGDVEGDSTLWAAARAGTVQGVHMIPQLVALGARETLGNKAMIAFARWPAGGAQPTDGEVEAALNALVSVGCSLTQPTDGWTPLDWAAYKGNAPVVRALLSLGVPATTSSLVQSVEHPGIIRVLLAAGAPPNGLAATFDDDASMIPQTPLMAAAHCAAIKSVQLLLAAGASVKRRDKSGKTALMWAITTDEEDDVLITRIIEARLISDADLLAQDFGGNTVLHHLVANQQASPWVVKIARLLRENGADVSAVNKTGHLPAHFIPQDQQDGDLFQALV